MCREFFRGLYIMLLKKEIYPGLRGAVLLFGRNSVRLVSLDEEITPGFTGGRKKALARGFPKESKYLRGNG